MVRIDEPIREDDGSYSRIIDIIKSELSHIRFIEGRPNIEELIPQEIHESNGSISFVTCGHPAMVDQVRYYCAKTYRTKRRRELTLRTDPSLGLDMVSLFTLFRV